MHMDTQPLVITIGHQIGSGGAYVGQKLAERLNLPFIDREILREVARRLHVAEGELEGREERLRSVWQTFSWAVACADPATSLFADQYVPTDQELFDFESEYITCIARERSAVFLGRCGHHILRQHKNHFRLLLYADVPFRTRRLGELYGWSAAEAEKKLEANDRDRAAYIRRFTGGSWLEPGLYDLCLNTSTLGLDKAVELALACVQGKTA
jgi:CMP/dCMP kinase